MQMDELSLAGRIAIWALPVIFAITVHEVAHGWVANKLGDTTAKSLGRLTLNPIKHIDLIGTIVVPAVLLMLGGFMFGWAKPVPVNFHNLRQPRRDTVLVAAAGPLSNLLMTIAWAIIVKITAMLPESMGMMALPLFYAGMFGILINLILMIFNLIPIPPTDGGRIATSLLPPSLGYQLSRLEPFGMVILLLLMLSGILGRLFGAIYHMAMTFMQFLL